MGSSEVNAFLGSLEHPLKEELLQLRGYITADFPLLAESIKWNAPNYQYEGTDFLTFNLSRPYDIKLILHRGAKVKEQLPARFIEDNSGLLKWAANDRAVITFTAKDDIAGHREALKLIILDWIGRL